MAFPTVYFWNKAPFVRLLMALVSGIVLQWQLQFSISFLALLLAGDLLLIGIYFFISLPSKFRFIHLNGILVHLLIAFAGAILIWHHDIRHNKNWIGTKNSDTDLLTATIEEPLGEKANSFKARASVDAIYDGKNLQKVTGQVILYFRKDTSLRQLHYGSQILFNKPLQEIKNTGNPGAFDYKRYCLFQGITHQTNLSANDFTVLPLENKNKFRQFILGCREWVVRSLRKFIRGEKEQGLAEALLIGYKDDLDKNLVQSYTNTGVVHIIAISGMHLALVYGILIFLTRPIRKKRWDWLRAVLILSGLWMFALLAGAQASVIRSAVMFTCIALGEVLSRRSFVYNTLALSAFVLLIYNPFWLWDAGFQLSYAAVASIVVFYRPVYNWFYFTNPLLDFVWKTMAISLAAQLLTTPLSLYHFHQFPTLFLLTNLVAVPLSGVILFGEIAICLLSWFRPAANWLGGLTELLIHWMNLYIERMETTSFSLWQGFSINSMQMVLLLITVASFCFWLLEQRNRMLWLSLGCCAMFTSLRSLSFARSYNQRKLIVYNVPKHLAMDLVAGRTCNFIGDSDLFFDDFLRNFHIRPSRVLHRIEQRQMLPLRCKELEFCNKRILIIDSSQNFAASQFKTLVDILVLSKNPKLYISNLLKTFSIKQVVIDGSVPQWKARLWKQDCDSFQIPCYDVSAKGAFVMNL